MNEHGPNWQGLKAYGIADLLIKCKEQGKRVYMMVLSGTEVVQGAVRLVLLTANRPSSHNFIKRDCILRT